MVGTYMSSPLTALLMVALAPVWVFLLALTTKKISTQRASAFALTTLFCGLVGAWLGSGGDAGTQLGFVWYSLAGFLVASTLFDGDQSVTLSLATVTTALFVLLTALVMGNEFTDPFRRPAEFVRAGSPVFAFEVYLLLVVRWMAGMWAVKHGATQRTSNEISRADVSD
jgi:hypothetical protein